VLEHGVALYLVEARCIEVETKGAREKPSFPKLPKLTLKRTASDPTPDLGAQLDIGCTGFFGQLAEGGIPGHFTRIGASPWREPDAASIVSYCTEEENAIVLVEQDHARCWTDGDAISGWFMPVSHGRAKHPEKSTPPPAEAIGGRTSLRAAWSMLLESAALYDASLAICFASIGVDFDARVPARGGYLVRVLATVAAQAGTVIQLMPAPFIGNGFFLAEVPSPEGDRQTCQSSPSVAQHPMSRRTSRWVPITSLRG
jgi:hypothetical protein